MKNIRYQRHYQLKGFGEINQQKLAKAKVLIVGAGGLGTPAAQYLNGMGIGTIGLIDWDSIEISNLPRQTLFRPKDVGKLKVSILARRLQEQNTENKKIAYLEYLTRENALTIIAQYDLVIDASDNFGTRYLINDACVILGKPFIYGAVHAFEGQISVLNYRNGPTYRCLFPEQEQLSTIPNCNENGVLSVLPGLIGTYQAVEAVKVLTQTGEPLAGKLLIIDGLSQTHLKINFSLKPENQNIKQLKALYGLPTCSKQIRSLALGKETLIQWLKERKKIEIIDVRTSQEFEQNKLPRAKNIPFQEIEIRHVEIEGKLPVVVVCQSGKRSTIAAEQLLVIKPHWVIYNLEGGLNSLDAVFASVMKNT